MTVTTAQPAGTPATGDNRIAVAAKSIRVLFWCVIFTLLLPPAALAAGLTNLTWLDPRVLSITVSVIECSLLLLSSIYVAKLMGFSQTRSWRRHGRSCRDWFAAAAIANSPVPLILVYVLAAKGPLVAFGILVIAVGVVASVGLLIAYFRLTGMCRILAGVLQSSRLRKEAARTRLALWLLVGMVVLAPLLEIPLLLLPSSYSVVLVPVVCHGLTIIAALYAVIRVMKMLYISGIALRGTPVDPPKKQKVSVMPANFEAMFIPARPRPSVAPKAEPPGDAPDDKPLGSPT